MTAFFSLIASRLPIYFSSYFILLIRQYICWDNIFSCTILTFIWLTWSLIFTCKESLLYLRLIASTTFKAKKEANYQSSLNPRDTNSDSHKTSIISSTYFLWIYCLFFSYYFFISCFTFGGYIYKSITGRGNWFRDGVEGTVWSYVKRELRNLWLWFVFMYLLRDLPDIKKIIINADYSFMFTNEIFKSAFKYQNKIQKIVEWDIG